MNTTIRNYETLYIVDATLTDEQVSSIIGKYSAVIAEQGGEVQAAGRWDKRRLAYEVKGRREGIYILMYFTGEPAVSKELDRVFRIADDVFRHIIVRVEPQHIDTSRIEHPPAPEAEAEGEAEPSEAAETAEAPEEGPEETPAEEPATAAEEAAPVEEPAAEPESEEPAEEAPAQEEPAEEPREEAGVEEPKAEEEDEEQVSG